MEKFFVWAQLRHATQKIVSAYFISVPKDEMQRLGI
jgi:hypothetical protein